MPQVGESRIEVSEASLDGNVLTFDAELEYNPAVGTAEEEFAGILDGFGMEYIEVCQETRLFGAAGEMSAARVICAEPDSLPGYYSLRDIKTGEELRLPEHGVIITKRIHEVFKLNVGDRFSLYDDSMDEYSAEVAGIFNNYFGQLIFLSPDAYRELFSADEE